MVEQGKAERLTVFVCVYIYVLNTRILSIGRCHATYHSWVGNIILPFDVIPVRALPALFPSLGGLTKLMVCDFEDNDIIKVYLPATDIL